MQLRKSRFFCLARGVLHDNGVHPLWVIERSLTFLRATKLHTRTKGRAHKILKALETHPKAAPWEIEIQFARSWAVKLSAELKMKCVEGPQHILWTPRMVASYLNCYS